MTCFLTAAMNISVLLSLARQSLTFVKRCCRGCLCEVHPDLRVLYLRIVNVDARLLSLEIPDQGDGCRLAGISCIGLECKSKHSNFLSRTSQPCLRTTKTRSDLASDRVEEGINDFLSEPSFLVFIHINDLLPVRSNLG